MTLPFFQHLILACFSVDARLPSKFRYEWALRILEKAHNSVKEPTDLAVGLVSGPQHLKRPNLDSLDQDTTKKEGTQHLKRPNFDSLHQDTKKGRYSLLL